MGTSRSWECNAGVYEIWQWAIQQNNWISVTHTPGIDNTAADKESRRIRIRCCCDDGK